METLELSKYIIESKLPIDESTTKDESITKIELPVIYGRKSPELREYEKENISKYISEHKDLHKSNLFNFSDLCHPKDLDIKNFNEIKLIFDEKNIKYTCISRIEYRNIFNKYILFPKKLIEDEFRVKIPDYLYGIKLPMWMTFSLNHYIWESDKNINVVYLTSHCSGITSKNTPLFFSCIKGVNLKPINSLWDYEYLKKNDLFYNQLNCRHRSKLHHTLDIDIKIDSVPVVPKRFNPIIDLIPDKSRINIAFMPSYDVKTHDDPFIYYDPIGKTKFDDIDIPIIVFGMWNKSDATLNTYLNE
jgi:hypothetical protein